MFYTLIVVYVYTFVWNIRVVSR